MNCNPWIEAAIHYQDWRALVKLAKEQTNENMRYVVGQWAMKSQMRLVTTQACYWAGVRP